MTTNNDLERLVITALHHHAEEAMNGTDTSTQLRDFLDSSDQEAARRRKWAIGALAAAVAVLAALAWWPGFGGPDAAPDPIAPTPELNSAEQLASEFVTAYFAFDRDLAASYVDDNATLTIGSVIGQDGWLRYNRMGEASGLDGTVDQCNQTQELASGGAEVGCLFTYHDLGSEQLGRGPWAEKVFNVTIEEGKVVDALMFEGLSLAEYEDEMYNPFMNWMSEAHPKDPARFDSWDSPDITEAQFRKIAGSLESPCE